MQNQLITSLKLLILALLLASCGSNEGKVEYKKTYHRNGKIHEVIPIVNGKIHGLKYEYYEDGALRLETPYDSGYVHGNVRYFYPDGKLYSETPRARGKIQGVVKKYHQNGSLLSETPYEDNNLLLGLKEYNSRGVLQPTPEIQFATSKRKQGSNMVVTLECSIPGKVRSVKYFQAIKNIDNDTIFIPFHSSEDVGRITVNLPQGSSIDVNLLIRAEFVTPLNNRCLIEGSHRLYAKN